MFRRRLFALLAAAPFVKKAAEESSFIASIEGPSMDVDFAAAYVAANFAKPLVFKPTGRLLARF